MFFVYFRVVFGVKLNKSSDIVKRCFKSISLMFFYLNICFDDIYLESELRKFQLT